MYDPKCSTTFPWCTINAPAAFAWCTINAPAVFAWCTNQFVHKVEFSYIEWNGVHTLWFRSFGELNETDHCGVITRGMRPVLNAVYLALSRNLFSSITFSQWNTLKSNRFLHYLQENVNWKLNTHSLNIIIRMPLHMWCHNCTKINKRRITYIKTKCHDFFWLALSMLNPSPLDKMAGR